MKLKLATKAKEWTERMEFLYKGEIEQSAEQSRVFRDAQLITPQGRADTKIRLVQTDTVTAIQLFGGPGTTVLSFASYRRPGGGFTSGAMAQEEALCHSSTLYPVLKRKQGVFYDLNEKQLNKRLYTDAAIYSPDIRFGEKKVGVITCAAPNKKAALKMGVTEKENNVALKKRIRYVISIAAELYTKTFIIGAWGCGVFGQDPYEVAQFFFDELKEMKLFETVVIAIPAGLNYDVFKEVFSKW